MPTKLNPPFRFVDSPNAVAELCEALDRIGLVAEPDSIASDTETDPYNPACWIFTCRKLSAAVELQWHFTWRPDGHFSELSSVRVSHKGQVIGGVDVDELLRQRLLHALTHVIVERLVTVCSELTRREAGI
jgi:hypothetical protein